MVDNTTMIELVDEISPILERLARRRRRSDGNSNTITYGNLASEVGPKVGIRNLPPNDKRLERALDEISMRSFRRHEILLSVLVVRADTRMPGRGFFELAKRRIAEQGLTEPLSCTPRQLRGISRCLRPGTRTLSKTGKPKRRSVEVAYVGVADRRRRGYAVLLRLLLVGLFRLFEILGYSSK
jgi:hypothetical protein